MVKRYLSGFAAAIGFALSCGFVLALTATASAAPISPKFEVFKPPQVENTNLIDTSAGFDVAMKCAALPAGADSSRKTGVHFLKTKPAKGEAYNIKVVNLMRVASYTHSRASPVPWRC